MFTGDLTQQAIIVAIGLLAGLIGGMTGLGGSLVMLPGLAIFVGYNDPSHPEQHTYQAAAMAVNFFVAVPATWRHTKAGAIRKTILTRLLPTGTVFIIVGALASDRIEGVVLVKLLAGVIALMVVLGEVSQRFGDKNDELSNEQRIKRATPTILGTGIVTGFVAGLLGTGGGVITVTALHALGRIPIRQAIAASTALMCLMSPIGCMTKMASLSQHGQDPMDAVRLIGMLGPAAIIGSLVGASLVHKLPTKVVRRIVAIVLLLAAAKLGGLF